MVCSPDIFNIVAGVLQGDTQAQYLLIICLYNIFRTWIDLIKENDFTLKKHLEADDILQKI